MNGDVGHIIDQLTGFWTQSLYPGLCRLTTADYLWEPVTGCWSLRVNANGRHTVDYRIPPPEPPPVTTIAWRIAYLVTNLSTRANVHFGAPPFAPADIDWPINATDGVQYLADTITNWTAHLHRLRRSDLTKPAGPAEGRHRDHSIAAMLLNANCQVVHHGGAILLQHTLRGTST